METYTFQNFINEIDYNEHQKKILDNLKYNNFYLVDYTQDDFKLNVLILGARKKVGMYYFREKYNIIFNKVNCRFSCDCKDFVFRSNSKGIVCKHISFLMCNVLNIWDHNYFKTKITNLDIHNLINNSTIWNNNNVSIKFLNANFKHSDKEFNKDDRCPICYENFNDAPVLNCPDCKNYVHSDCVKIWLTYSDFCCYCRSTCWEDFRDPNYI